jgi:HEAT repeat protein
MAAGCPKKQDKSAQTPASSDTKSPRQDTQIAMPVVEANTPSAVIAPTEPAVDKKETTADNTPPKVADAKPAMQQEAPAPPQPKAPPMPEQADLKPLESLKDADEKIEFISDYADEHPESAAAMVYNVLDDKDVNVRTAAMEMLAMKDLDDSNVVLVASKALKDSDPQVRKSAVEACTPITDPAVKNVLLEAIADSSGDVRTASLQLADQKEPIVRMDVLKAGITSQYEDVKESVVTSLIDVSSPAAMDILITGLKDANPDFRDEVKSAISLLVSQDFDTYDQAQKWWNANRDKYDNALVEKD